MEIGLQPRRCAQCRTDDLTDLRDSPHSADVGPEARPQGDVCRGRVKGQAAGARVCSRTASFIKQNKLLVPRSDLGRHVQELLLIGDSGCGTLTEEPFVPLFQGVACSPPGAQRARRSLGCWLGGRPAPGEVPPPGGRLVPAGTD